MKTTIKYNGGYDINGSKTRTAHRPNRYKQAKKTTTMKICCKMTIKENRNPLHIQAHLVFCQHASQIKKPKEPSFCQRTN